MKLEINPKYDFLRGFLLDIEQQFEKARPVFRGVSRNEVREITVKDHTLWIKRYGKTKLKHKLRPWRSSQAKKAYIGPLRLRERGFDSPDPVAYISVRRGLVKHHQYFISLKMNLRFCMEDFADLHEKEYAEGIVAFGRFMARLHDKGVRHTNLSPKNILFDYVDHKWRFALIGANRIKTTHRIGVKEGCKNFARLEGNREFFAQVAAVYAETRGYDPAQCTELIWSAHEAWEKKRKF